MRIEPDFAIAALQCLGFRECELDGVFLSVKYAVPAMRRSVMVPS